MIHVENDQLKIVFPEVHDHASMSIDFQRTLRIPDNDETYSLPAGLGRCPIRHVDDYQDSIPTEWIRHGGVLMPMYQAEAMWMNFRSMNRYPIALKVAAGKINAVTGEEWREGLHDDPQDYLVIPIQPWLDGFCVEKGVIRQFVAAALGDGLTVEAQLTGKEDVGGLQLIAYPIKRDLYLEILRKREEEARKRYSENVQYCMAPEGRAGMGLAAGGRMRQEVYEDHYGIQSWDLENSSRCFVHIANSRTWKSITGSNPPHQPPTAERYVQAGIPWFIYYDDESVALSEQDRLAKVQSYKALLAKKQAREEEERRRREEKQRRRTEALEREKEKNIPGNRQSQQSNRQTTTEWIRH